MNERIFLYDFSEQANIRYISFSGVHRRFDLAIVNTNQFFGKQLILDMQSTHFAIIGRDDLEEEGYLEAVYQLSEEEAVDLRNFLNEIM